MIHIDGSYMEGGGQIVRTALALSALTRKPFRIDEVRDNRIKPGLQRQHLSCVEALKQISGVRVTGAQPASVSPEFSPGAMSTGTFSIDIGTAGSVRLPLG
jgi:RNA 3'-terminal phosphate cyclase (ATP)